MSIVARANNQLHRRRARVLGVALGFVISGLTLSIETSARADAGSDGQSLNPQPLPPVQSLKPQPLPPVDLWRLLEDALGGPMQDDDLLF